MDQISVQLTEALLKELAARANNIIMQGSFTGDACTEASEVMALCHRIHTQLEKK